MMIDIREKGIMRDDCCEFGITSLDYSLPFFPSVISDISVSYPRPAVI
jgi:hypothetical protein